MSEAPTLQFVIMIEPAFSRKKFVDLLLSAFPDACSQEWDTVDVRGNWLKLLENPEANQSNVDALDDGFLYYSMEMQATPLHKNIDEDHQLLLARDLMSLFQANGFKTVLCAAFEARLDEFSPTNEKDM